MPVSAEYIQNSLALSKMRLFQDAIIDIKSLMGNLNVLIGQGFTEAQLHEFKVTYLSMVAVEMGKIQSGAQDMGLTLSLSGAVEGGQKTSLLAVSIAGVPVNPASSANAAEQAAMVVDDGKNLIALNEIIAQANDLFSQI